ncbi:Inositol-1-monophosphatase [Microbacterium ginsengisoli]|jgi:myo-inositol-1(or 4)-monophosphatase|uniref:Inositol-1-monophosphatase n=2 Tax=Microbacterium ginsengisoli TaxID=400772 RepID=A0A0F0LXT7_9MICO|nr:inositol monophosphatase family protein [Microbacterium ginsengisoli]KJL36176.1 Inositol-1-monophosphatase [Microbacterium ginsengisoli]MBN9208124.1 inositol monophosphatase [Microbacterium ginsengisoli]
MTLPLELQSLAVEIAREAGELAARRRAEGVTIAATKSALADIVTEADREVEALIRDRLAAARPDDGFLGEESGGDDSRTGIVWVVDPIDGTVNYAYGLPIYAVSIGIVTGSSDPAAWESLAGVVYAPALGELYRAARGEGAWIGDHRLHVSPEIGPAGALLGTGFGYDPATHAGDLAAVGAVLPLARDLRRMGAASLDLAAVAAGRLDGYYERGLKPWDIAAGALLVEEAGGVFWREGGPDAAARPLSIAAPAPLFEKLAEALRNG